MKENLPSTIGLEFYSLRRSPKLDETISFKRQENLVKGTQNTIY